MKKHVVCRVIDAAPLSSSDRDCPPPKSQALSALHCPVCYHPTQTPPVGIPLRINVSKVLLEHTYGGRPFPIGNNLNTAF